MLGQCLLEIGGEYGYILSATCLFLSFFDPTQYCSFFLKHKSLLRGLSASERANFLPGYFWQDAGSLIYHSGACKTKNRWGSFGTKWRQHTFLRSSLKSRTSWVLFVPNCKEQFARSDFKDLILGSKNWTQAFRRSDFKVKMIVMDGVVYCWATKNLQFSAKRITRKLCESCRRHLSFKKSVGWKYTMFYFWPFFFKISDLCIGRSFLLCPYNPIFWTKIAWIYRDIHCLSSYYKYHLFPLLILFQIKFYLHWIEPFSPISFHSPLWWWISLYSQTFKSWLSRFSRSVCPLV